MSRHIFLIGFMGAGKSTVSRLLAERLGWASADLDELVESSTGLKVREIFAQHGEQEFRRLESEALASVESMPDVVVACGGGAVLLDRNRALLKRLGTVVYLKVSASAALGRIGDVASRPLLAGPSGTLAATALLAAREGIYTALADFTVDTAESTPEEVAERIYGILSERGVV